MSLLDRFVRVGERNPLVESLRDQQMVNGDAVAAARLAGVATLAEYAPGATLDVQGSTETDVYYLLIGEVSIMLNGQEVARRHAGQHVGEMAMIDRSAHRAATIVARDQVIAAKVTEPAFTAVAQEHPYLWRRIAVELGARLRQRGRFVRERNATPIVFIGSSRESLPVVEALTIAGTGLPYILRPWTGGVFAASSFPIDDLAAQVVACDFAALVLGPDDLVISRGKSSDAPRDNVVFELGLFMGALARSRTFLVVPRGLDVKIPTDLSGLTPIHYTPDLSDLATVCGEITQAVSRLGAR
jgi:CRP/FNR family cyclic AMP-dependent transcriptional regulator